MTITKHGVMRFKQRQKIKNNDEMKRKASFALERGKLLSDHKSNAKVRCYLFDGYYYIFDIKDDRLVTVYRPNKPKIKNKKLRTYDIKIKEFVSELRYSFVSI